MAFVYLIGENNNENTYKIGLTKSKNINNRLKKLQTGNSSELFIKAYFETDTPYKLEKMLHNHFSDKQIINEWYYLNNDDIISFNETCQTLQKNIESLKDNPFFKTN